MNQTITMSKRSPGHRGPVPGLLLLIALGLLPFEAALSQDAALSKGAAAPELAAIPMKDPTRPNWYGIKARARKAASSLELSSIIISANRRLAVINGDLMREGEQRNGLLLKEVLKDRVLVVNADKQLRALRLPVTKPVKG